MNIIQASQRKKFGIKNVLSGGGGDRSESRSKSSKNHHNSNSSYHSNSSCHSDSSHHSSMGQEVSGTKRSWRSAKEAKQGEFIVT